MDKPYVDFYTDKKTVINEIHNTESDKYEIHETEDEIKGILFVDKTEDIINFSDFSKERLGMSGNDVYDLVQKFGILVVIILVKCQMKKPLKKFYQSLKIIFQGK